jgi:hypothetical protein
MKTVLVNAAEWETEERPEIPAGWVVANAPRPLRAASLPSGEVVTWTGPFRHGVIYAAAPEVITGTWGWEADDAWLVELITNDRIRELAMAKLADHGYTTLEDADMTMEEMAAMMQLPWIPE